MKIRSFKLKLIFSYIFIILVSFGLIAFFLDRNLKTVLLGLIFALAIALVLGSVIAAQTIRSINRMIQVSRKFSEGDFSRRIIQSSNDEIGELAATLNKMAQGLEDKVKEIKAQNQKLAAIFNSMIEGIIVVDKEFRITSVNPTIEKIFNVSKEEAEGKVFLEAILNKTLYLIFCPAGCYESNIDFFCNRAIISACL
ncbi:MAG: HAMP domain-containing protein, partial [Candidatus Omnitrophica bacterium]|nr:HAMP domain-containing protein [Candidatus Omnitrophota bacterium]